MSYTANLKTAKDLLAKLERDGATLQDEVSSDAFFNFVVTAYSLCDWVEKDPSVNANAKADLANIRSTTAIRMCRDLANGNKHFELDQESKQRAVVATVSANAPGYGVGRFGVGGYGVGEESITIVLTDGTRIDLLQFKDDVLKAWKDFFLQHQI